MPLTKEQLLENIRTAFRGVKLGDGVGLWQAQAIDRYKLPYVQDRVRMRDEKENWEAISIKNLNWCYSSLSFFDPDGMRFHLPAFLISELEGTFDMIGPVFSVSNLSDYKRSQLTSLSASQCAAVRDFLEFIRDDPNYAFERPDIDLALSTFWTPKAEGH